MNTYNTLGAFSDQPELAPDIEARIFDWLREFQDDLSDHLDEALRLGGHLQWVVDLVGRARTEKDKEKRLESPANVPASSAPDRGSPTVAVHAESLPARARGGTPSDLPPVAVVASPPTSGVSAVVARRNRMRAEAAKPVVDLAAVLDEARKRAASNPEPAKKISTEIQPRKEHHGTGKAKQQPRGGEPLAVAVEPEPVVEASRALVVVPQDEPVPKAKLLDAMNTKHHVIGNYGGKCVVLSWERWDVNRDVFVPEIQTFDDIVKVYLNLLTGASKLTAIGGSITRSGNSMVVWCTSPAKGGSWKAICLICGAASQSSRRPGTGH